MGWKDYLWDKFNEATDQKNWEKSLEIARAIQAERDAEEARKQAERDAQKSGWFGRRSK